MSCPQVRITAMVFSSLVLVLLLFFLGFSMGIQAAWDNGPAIGPATDDYAGEPTLTPIP